MNLNKRIGLLILSSILATSCSTIPKSDSNVIVIDENVKSDVKTSDQKNLLVFGLEDKGVSFKKCGLITFPNLALSGGLVAIISNPITPFIALGYYGGSYYSCYWQRQNDIPTVQMNLVVEEARKKTADELRDSFNKLRDKLDLKTNDYVKDVEGIQQKIKASGEEEKKAIERTGSKVLKELYEQLDAIRNTPIQIKEIETEEKMPKTLLDNKE